MWAPKFHLTDPSGQLIKSASGDVVKCSDKKFGKFICLTEEELYKLYEQCIH